jgi:hypothetical protein
VITEDPPLVQNLVIVESFKTMVDPNSTPDEFVVEFQELLKIHERLRHNELTSVADT